MKAVVDQGQEVSHAEERLEVEPEQKWEASGDGQDRGSNAPIGNHAIVE